MIFGDCRECVSFHIGLASAKKLSNAVTDLQLVWHKAAKVMSRAEKVPHHSSQTVLKKKNNIVFLALFIYPIAANCKKVQF